MLFASGPLDHIVELLDGFVVAAERGKGACEVIARCDAGRAVRIGVGGGLQLRQRRVQLRALRGKAAGRAQ